MMIPIDTGNKAIKTEHYEFNAGLAVLEKAPAEKEEAIYYKGVYYRLSESRGVYLEDKTEDERYYVLTLFAIAKELKFMQSTRTILSGELLNLDLVVGLPPLYYRGERKKFAEYFYRGGQINEIGYMDNTYKIGISNVYVHMQTYAAYFLLAGRLKLSTHPKVLILDIGGFTFDYMLLRYGKVDWDIVDSMPLGVIPMYRSINRGIREKFNMDLEESDIDNIILGYASKHKQEVIERTIDLATDHINKCLGRFRECGIDLRTTLTIFTGGGTALLHKIIEKEWKRYQGEYYIINDTKANVKGYKQKYLADKGLL